VKVAERGTSGEQNGQKAQPPESMGILSIGCRFIREEGYPEKSVNSRSLTKTKAISRFDRWLVSTIAICNNRERLTPGPNPDFSPRRALCDPLSTTLPQWMRTYDLRVFCGKGAP
jgi:hypothetical protein